MFTSVHAKHTPISDSKEESKENENVNQQNPNIVKQTGVKQKISSNVQSPAKKKVNKKRSLMRL
jgi:hypothetical protein